MPRSKSWTCSLITIGPLFTFKKKTKVRKPNSPLYASLPTLSTRNHVPPRRRQAWKRRVWYRQDSRFRCFRSVRPSMAMNACPGILVLECLSMNACRCRRVACIPPCCESCIDITHPARAHLCNCHEGHRRKTSHVQQGCPPHHLPQLHHLPIRRYRPHPLQVPLLVPRSWVRCRIQDRPEGLQVWWSALVQGFD